MVKQSAEKFRGSGEATRRSVPCPRTGLSEDARELLAKRLWTIGDDVRLCLLGLLPASETATPAMNVSQLAGTLGLSQPTISNHLARLRTLGIVRHRRVGRDVFYWIDAEAAERILEDLRRALKTQGADAPE
ncbi:MAG: helix-turn-helix transcriptional regulator [Opitutales bacterium]|nr:helix-turn-helix transcriptional regulator [Opitutales bacterium]